MTFPMTGASNMSDFRTSTRRRFLEILGGLALNGVAIGFNLSTTRAIAAEPAPSRKSSVPRALLEESPFVYISPLLANGQESSCHAELWYAWLDDSIVVNVASDRWKATALTRGLDRARIWVGDHGRWKGLLGSRNEDFRGAPHFDARVERVEDATTLDELLAMYEKKYPEEIARWRDPMRSGVADGSRVLLRYRSST
jgi:hypothetical protein